MDPTFPEIAAFAAAFLCLVFALALLRRNRALERENRELQAQVEDFADEAWRLRESAERAMSLINTQGDLIVRRDAQGRITFANEAFCELVGRNAEDLAGTFYDLPVITHGVVTTLVDGTRVHDQEIDGEAGSRWISWREVLTTNPAASEIETQSVGRDVTARVESESALAEARDAAEAASRAKSRFLAAMSHEVRTPLNGILGMSDLLLHTSLTPEQTTYADAVRTSGKALLAIVDDVLDFAKIEAGKVELAAEPFSPSTLIEEIVELLAPRAQAKALEIAADVDERLPARVLGDATRLRQILLNLVGNAVKFTEFGGVTILVEAGSLPGEVSFAVRDSGIGIDPEQQARIFGEFEQAEGARKFGGTGLGLAIARGLVERMGGVLAFESRSGEGATFRFSVALPSAEESQTGDAPAPALDGQSILVVSRSVTADLIARRVSRWGALVSLAENEFVARALLPERRWDCVLVDRAVGDAVYDLVRLHRARDARYVVLTTPAHRAELPVLRAAGYDAYLIKPVRAASLAAVLSGGTADAQALEPDARPAALLAPSARIGLSVLVAEDNEINALLTRTLLSKMGHRPTVVGDGEVAVSAWEKARTSDAPFDLVLMDVEMPRMDGLEATRRIRAAEGEGLRVRIVGLTANALAEDHSACLEAGMDACLTKPLERDAFVAEFAAGRSDSVAA